MNKKFLNIILYLTAIICLAIVINKFYNYYKDNIFHNSIIEQKKSYNDKIKPQNFKAIYQHFKKLNPDYIFWISITDTAIDYPVVQGKDNDFYLINNFYKENSISGTIFLDFKNDPSKDRNLILYGHNMRNGSMFSGINIFKEKEFFDKGTIKITNENGEKIYEVFSVFVEDTNKITLKNNFANENEYIEYINILKEKSYYSKDINNNFHSIITLYTCSYEFNNARTIVCATLKEDVPN